MKKRIKGKLMLHHLLFHHFLKTTRFLKQEKADLKISESLFYYQNNRRGKLNEEWKKKSTRDKTLTSRQPILFL